MLRRVIARSFSELKPKRDMLPKQQNRIVTSAYRQMDTYFPKLIPRLVRFTWSDLVIYCELFFIGLMVYIHFIDA